MCSFVVLESTTDDVSEPVHESSVEEPSQEPLPTESVPGALVPEQVEAESASETVPEDPTPKSVLEDSSPEPSVTEAVPEALFSESPVREQTGEEVTHKAPVTKLHVTEEQSAEEPPDPVVESGKPVTSARSPEDVLLIIEQMKELV